MFQKHIAQKWLQEHVHRHLPSNAASVRTSTLTTRLNTSAVGFSVDPPPFHGPVIEVNPAFSVVKTGDYSFVIIDPGVLREPLSLGAIVTVTPYARRHFDGSLLSTPVDHRVAGTNVTVQVSRLGHHVSAIPVDPPHSPFGKHMLDTLQRLRCPDGVRVLSNLLVDIGASNFIFIDPDADDPGDMQFLFDCSNSMFSGRVTIGIDQAKELFYIEMHKVQPDGTEPLLHRCNAIELDHLAEVISTLLCDGQWKYATVDVHQNARIAESQLSEVAS